MTDLDRHPDTNCSGEQHFDPEYEQISSEFRRYLESDHANDSGCSYLWQRYILDESQLVPHPLIIRLGDEYEFGLVGNYFDKTPYQTEKLGIITEHRAIFTGKTTRPINKGQPFTVVSQTSTHRSGTVEVIVIVRKMKVIEELESEEVYDTLGLTDPKLAKATKKIGTFGIKGTLFPWGD